MFELIFGIFWTAIIGVITLAMYSSGGTIRVNGQLVSQSEFNSMLWPKLFIGVFWAIGIFMIVLGLKKLLVNVKTSVKGIRTYGVVIDILETNCYANGHPQLKADVVVIMQNKTTARYQEVIGYDYNKYRIGEALEVKHCDKDINILGIAIENQIPYGDREIIDGIRQEYGCTMEYANGHFGRGSERVYRKVGPNAHTEGSRGTGSSGFGYVVDDFDNYMSNGGQGGYSSNNSRGYNDGYTTHTVNLDGYGAPNNEVQHVDENTVIINGVEYKKNS